MTPIDRSPARLSAGVAVLAGVVAAGASASGAPAAVGGAGVVALVVGLVRRSHRTASLGAAALLGSVVVAGVWGASAEALLVGATGTVLAWDAARTAIGLGDQLGAAAGTRRLEAVHLAASGGVAVLTAGVGYGVYRAAAGGQPVTALVLLLVAAVLLASALA